MSLDKCPDCHHEVSDQAISCVKCGRLTAFGLKRQGTVSSMWDIIARLRAPINVFAFAMMAAAAIFGMYAVDVMSDNDLQAFAFALHVFLAIAGMFFVTLLFCPGRIYHPKDLEGITLLEKNRPEWAVAIIVAMILIYGVYQWFRLSTISCFW